MNYFLYMIKQRPACCEQDRPSDPNPRDWAMAFKTLPPIELLRQLFEYDYLDGGLYRNFHDIKQKVAYSKRPENPVGAINPTGYAQIIIKNEKFLLHRIIWAMHHGEDPGEYVIDHIDGNTFNNNIKNLEKITLKENQKRRKNQKAGVAKRKLGALKKSKFFKEKLKQKEN